jgi:hypothetical protein
MMQKAANAAGTTLSSIMTPSMPFKTRLDLEGDGALRSLAHPTTGQVDDDASALELGAHHQQQRLVVPTPTFLTSLTT